MFSLYWEKKDLPGWHGFADIYCWACPATLMAISLHSESKKIECRQCGAITRIIYTESEDFGYRYTVEKGHGITEALK